MPKKPSRPRAAASFPPLTDAELTEFLRELTATLPEDLAALVHAALERGDAPGPVARSVRDELRQRGHIPR